MLVGGQELTMGNLRKWQESLKLLKAERVHGRIFCDVQCTWQRADDKIEAGGVI